MHIVRPMLFAVFFGASHCIAQSAVGTLSNAHDGRWSVFLSCPDIEHKAGVARGYKYNFAVQIAGGQLEGRFDESTPPAFIHLVGRVLADGSVLINADGLSGSPDATIGKLPRGSPYHYTMRGTLEANRGKAERVELRPCTAEFVRQSHQ